MSRARKPLRERENTTDGSQVHTVTRDEESLEYFSGFEEKIQQDKGNTELELEKAVFGDEFGFHEHLREHALAAGDRTRMITEGTLSQTSKDKDDALNDIEDIRDADLFVLHSGPSAKPFPPTVYQDEEASAENTEAAWYDSDDERIVVSLQDNPRLRKLRNYEEEDLVNGVEYTKRLRRQFERLYPTPAWAVQARVTQGSAKSRGYNLDASEGSSADPGSEDEMSVDSSGLSAPPLAKLLQQPKALIREHQGQSRGRRKLRPEVINIQRTKDVGETQPSAVTCLAFHPCHPLLISSGPAGTVSLHHILPRPPNPNPLLTTLHIKHTSINTSSFRPPQGSKILFAGRRRYFHTWDLETGRISRVSRIHGHQSEQKSMERFKLSPCGRWMGLFGSQRKGGGQINVLDAHTNMWVAEVRVESNSGVADFAWWGDGEGMVLLGKGGEAVEWDGRQKRIIARWVDEGAVGTTTAAIGGRGSGAKDIGGDRWIAVGSSSGIVNVYDRKNWGSGNLPANPKPTRAFDQLTTPTSHLVFSPDGQLLIMGSRWKQDALRLVHLPSCTVYRNWPTSSTSLGRITSVAISPNSETIAVANEQGKIRLWEIRA